MKIFHCYLIKPCISYAAQLTNMVTDNKGETGQMATFVQIFVAYKFVFRKFWNLKYQFSFIILNFLKSYNDRHLSTPKTITTFN